MSTNNPEVLQAVQNWLKDVVVGLQLCPFAKAPMNKGEVHYHISAAMDEEGLNDDLIQECQRLDREAKIETTLLVCPHALRDFFDFCQYLNWANNILKQHGWVGTYQLAHFHPHYCFAGADEHDTENLSNRSPFPIIHILREESLTQILDRYDEPETIPEKNKRTLERLTSAQRRQLFAYLYDDS